MMRPISIEKSGEGFIITHKCEICGKEKRQHASEKDDINTIIELSKKPDFIFGKKFVA